MKKLTKVLLILITVLALTVGLVACAPDQLAKDNTAITVYIGETKCDISIPKDTKTNLFQEVKTYCEKNSIPIDYTDNVEFGAFLNSIGELNPASAKNEFIVLYTSVVADKLVDQYGKSIEFKGVTLYNSRLGISTMTIENNAVYYIRIETWS